MAKFNYNPIQVAYRILDEIKIGTEGFGLSPTSSMDTAMTALYLFQALSLENVEGMEVHSLSKKMGFQTHSTALRHFYLLGDKPDLARGGKCLGWFQLKTNVVDQRYKNISLSNRGNKIKQNCLGIGTELDPKIERMARDHDELRATAVLNHDESVQGIGRFSWLRWKEDGYGQSEKKPIPYREGYLALPADDRAALSGKRYWWVDEKTGHKWNGTVEMMVKRGNPYAKVNRQIMEQRPKIRLNRKDVAVTYFHYEDAIKQEKAGKIVRRRNANGDWLAYDADDCGSQSEPIGPVLPMSDEQIDKYIWEMKFKYEEYGDNLEMLLGKADFELSKSDFTKVRKAISDFLHKEEVKRHAEAETRKHEARVAEEMSRKAATDANRLTSKSMGLLVPNDDAKAMKDEANQLAQDSAAWEERGAISRKQADKLMAENAEIREQLAQVLAMMKKDKD